MKKTFRPLLGGAFLLAFVMQAHAHDQSAKSDETAQHAGHHSDANHHTVKAGEHASPVAQDVVAGDLTLSAGSTRAMLPGQPVGGGYVTITNKGAADDRLIAATSSRSEMVELHEMAMQGEVMRMRKLDGGIVIPAGKTIQLKPGGLHLMFMKVKEPFAEGKPVPVTLVFEKAGNVEILLSVQAARTGAHPH